MSSDSWHKLNNSSVSLRRFSINGDHRTTFCQGAKIKVIEAGDNNGRYTVESSSFSGAATLIIVNEPVNHDSINEGWLKLRRPYPYGL